MNVSRRRRQYPAFQKPARYGTASTARVPVRIPSASGFCASRPASLLNAARTKIRRSELSLLRSLSRSRAPGTARRAQVASCGVPWTVPRLGVRGRYTFVAVSQSQEASSPSRRGRTRSGRIRGLAPAPAVRLWRLIGWRLVFCYSARSAASLAAGELSSKFIAR